MSERYRTVGDAPIAFAGDQEGDLTVVATCTPSRFAPHARVALASGTVTP